VPWVGGPPDASLEFYLREAFQSQTNTEKLEGCIVLHEHDTIFTGSGPLYVIGPFAHPSPERKRYLDRFRIFCMAH